MRYLIQPFKVPNIKDIFPVLPRYSFDHGWVGMLCGRETNFSWTPQSGFERTSLELDSTDHLDHCSKSIFPGLSVPLVRKLWSGNIPQYPLWNTYLKIWKLTHFFFLNMGEKFSHLKLSQMNPYSLVFVTGQHKTEEFKKINPSAQVPAFICQDGWSLSER